VIQKLATLAWNITYARYMLASVAALGCDMLSFLVLLHFGIPPVPASMAGYSFGIAVHWLLSSRLVFTSRSEGLQRHRQKLLFVGSALLGLAITGATVGMGHMLGLDPRIAKLGAIMISFQATYLLRRKLVFA
jgi:putative flippase GtrA